MWAAVRWSAILLAIGAGTLGAALAALLLWAALAVAGVEDAPQIGLVVGILTGIVMAGAVAGRLAPIAHRFHGSIAGLVLAGMWVVLFRIGGSPAPTPQVLLLAVLGVVIGGIGGFVAGRRAR